MHRLEPSVFFSRMKDYRDRESNEYNFVVAMVTKHILKVTQETWNIR
jgi:hypothetical protein